MVVSKMGQHACQPWPILWSRHKSARLVSPSLALLDECKRVCRESVYGDMCLEDDPAWRYAVLPKPISLSGNWTSIVSRWVPNSGVPTFSHWILDALPRLALLKGISAGHKNFGPVKISGLPKGNFAIARPDRSVTRRSGILFWRIIISVRPTAMIANYNPYGVNWLRSAFLPLADKSIAARKGSSSSARASRAESSTRRR